MATAVRLRNRGSSTSASSRINAGVLFRENTKWRHNAAMASAIDDGGKEVRVVLTGAIARVHLRQDKKIKLGTEDFSAVNPQIFKKLQPERPDNQTIDNLEEDLRRLLDQISTRGKPVYRVLADSTTGSEHIECCEELTQWTFRLLKNMPGDDEWRMKIERMVYKVLFEHIRKTKSGRIMEMLSWLKQVAKDPLFMADLNLNVNNLSQLQRMAMLTRDAMFLKVNELSATQVFLCPDGKKPGVQRQLSAGPGPDAGDPSALIGQTSLSANVTLTRRRRRSTTALGVLKFSHFKRKRVRVGPSFQAEIPAWTDRTREISPPAQSKWLGTLILP